MVPMDVEDAYPKMWVPTIVMYHRSFQCCNAMQTTVNIGGHQMKWKHHTTCCSKCSLTGGGGMQKLVGIIGKNFCQTHTFAFIICLALSKQDEMCKKIYGGNYYFQNLTQEHVNLLQQYGYWEHILKSCQNLIDNANCEQTG